MNQKELAERRKNKRFLAQEGAFAVIGPEFTKLGQIMNISRGGFAFRYIVTGSQGIGAAEADIFLAGDGFYLEKIPIKPIWDLKVPKKLSNGSLPMRRCGVQFRELTRHQRAQLEYFIQNHTLDRFKGFKKGEPLTSPQNLPSNS
ncbi:MAG: PilZ domain-containing protein [Deltaproteobacteria bacterium]|nr:MAG: PilZ domain-containing protein [Deltaproteobacteria bacterium]